jgi:glutaredoxin
MKMKLELFFFPECPYCQIVLDSIQKNKLQDKIILLNTREDSSSKERLIKDTGRRTVPCLYVNNTPMHESAEISRWLTQNAHEILNGN